MSSADKNSNGNSLSQITNSQELRSNIQNISRILNTGLSPETLDICIQLCEAGVHPQALANVIQQIRREVAQIQQSNDQQNTEWEDTNANRCQMLEINPSLESRLSTC